MGHASHEACELKYTTWEFFNQLLVGHASHEACELKFRIPEPPLRAAPSRLA